METPNYIIKMAREEKGLSQRELAKQCGISHATVVKAEKGGSIAPRTWKKLKDALGISKKNVDNDEYVLMF